MRQKWRKGKVMSERNCAYYVGRPMCSIKERSNEGTAGEGHQFFACPERDTGKVKRRRSGRKVTTKTRTTIE
jgi:hypothetical protein